MTPHEFKAKWSTASGNERQTYQEHFRDLCAMLHQPTPSAADRLFRKDGFTSDLDRVEHLFRHYQELTGAP